MPARRNRAENRAHMEAQILRLGREQLATRGPADLSLREIARDLGVASSALYRYVADRDTLLTRLIVDAYDDLADAVTSAIDGTSDAPRLLAFARAMRAWAVTNPARWGLIYGTPVPGYAAPSDATTGPGTRLMAVLMAIVATGRACGDEPDGTYRAFLEGGASEFGVETDARHAADAVEVWCGVVGTISMEIFGQLGPDAGHAGEAALERALAGWAQRLFG